MSLGEIAILTGIGAIFAVVCISILRAGARSGGG
jgi:hypothetical protein